MLQRASNVKPGVVSVMLEACVDKAVVWRNKAVLVAAVKVDTVCVEEEPVSGANEMLCACEYLDIVNLVCVF